MKSVNPHVNKIAFHVSACFGAVEMPSRGLLDFRVGTSAFKLNSWIGQNPRIRPWRSEDRDGKHCVGRDAS